MNPEGAAMGNVSNLEPLHQIETASIDEIRNLQLQRLRHTLGHVYANSPLYREKLDAHGVHPDHLKSLDDLARFPFTSKQDLRDRYPFGVFSVPMEQVVRIHASSGTTGKPTVVGYTQDLTRLLPGTARRMRRIEKITGRSDDMMIIRGVNVFPSQIEEQLLLAGGLSPHYYISLGKDGHLDTLTVHVEFATGAGIGAEDHAAQALKQRIKSHVGVSAQVFVHPIGGIPRSEGKARRVVDQR